MKAGLCGKKNLVVPYVIHTKKARLETKQTIILSFLEENVKFFPQRVDSHLRAKRIIFCLHNFSQFETNYIRVDL